MPHRAQEEGSPFASQKVKHIHHLLSEITSTHQEPHGLDGASAQWSQLRLHKLFQTDLVAATVKEPRGACVGITLEYSPTAFSASFQFVRSEALSPQGGMNTLFKPTKCSGTGEKEKKAKGMCVNVKECV